MLSRHPSYAKGFIMNLCHTKLRPTVRRHLHLQITVMFCNQGRFCNTVHHKVTTAISTYRHNDNKIRSKKRAVGEIFVRKELV